MDLKNIAANFNSFSRLLDDEIRSRIPESGQIDIEPEDKCVFHDDNDDRPEHRIVKAVFLSSDGTVKQRSAVRSVVCPLMTNTTS